MHPTTIVLMLAALFVQSVSTATVTLTNGSTVTGTIQGRLLTRRGSAEDPGLRIVDGKDVTRIDDAGVACAGDSVVVMGMSKTPTPTDDLSKALVVWEEGQALKKGQGLIRKVGKSQIVGARVDCSSMKPVPEVVLGDYRTEGNVLKPSGSIRVLQADGTTVTIAVTDIVAYKVAR